jgi:hypothetical protein
LQDPPKFTQIWIFGLKTNHLATLDVCMKIQPCFVGCRVMMKIFFFWKLLPSQFCVLQKLRRCHFQKMAPTISSDAAFFDAISTTLPVASKVFTPGVDVMIFEYFFAEKIL